MRRPGWTEEDVYRIAERGYSLHLQGRYREAAVIFEGLVAADPENSYCRQALAAARLALGEPQRAIDQLSPLIHRNPDELAARTRRFEAYLQAENLAGALADFELLRRLLPRSEFRRLELLLEAAVSKATLPEDLR